MDTTDIFHDRTVAFFETCTQQGVPLTALMFMPLEAACVLARRFRRTSAGERAVAAITSNGLVRLVPVDDRLVELAIEIGMQRFLRGADALYAAAAELTGSTLVSWDNELIQRAGARSPSDWLDGDA
jgi:predicted nucleic acid-binding protein